MAYTITVTQRVTGGANTIDGSFDITAGQLQEYSETIPGSSTDEEVAMVLDFSQIEYLIMLSDVDLLMETNAIDATGGDAISLVAGEALEWVKGQGVTCPFTSDVTVAYFTEAAAADALFTALFLIDPTV